MSDIAQLRGAIEALKNWGGVMPQHTDALGVVRKRVIEAAEEFLTIREAGALIIVPDADGNWPASTERVVAAFLTRAATLRHATLVEVRQLLDALRDAMPDGTPNV